ncbi:hypothetical protein PT306_02560 [Metamycoplasma hyosynoviae]|uniref:hypothetical protein n=1 Tax=Metamycoplasma hyosynoviae TaxID=29559 RepID=UPI0023593C2E|nr:hypothetical protein [Metamycoplasma hyosynoviae]MDC8915851.1 hypothetical protein [Metamycoplasma hyosynoviae]MDC8918624.1 hypothetical protein [Metamycoplasma hyosynoviae]MDC8920676.1 hypothetical protein [Metamycoplasma hyosynoviae]MDC8922021.1 hypothetical protein [Metamycoplasma hyosynoviae]MDD1366515.1 hypothetical protein [Metamycoplasma hyosynoviae]
MELKNLEQWYEYFKKDKTSLKLLKQYVKKYDQNLLFNTSIKPINNKFVAKIGMGNNRFNEITIKALIKAYLSTFAVKSPIFTHKLNILIASDEHGIGKINNFVEYITEVVNGYGLSSICFKAQTPVTKQFLIFAIKKIEKLDGIIYFSKFNENDSYSLEFIDNYGNDLEDERILKINEVFQNMDMFDIKTFSDRPTYLNIDMLLEEYTNYVLKFNYNHYGNKVLNLGIYASQTIQPFIKKVMGWNDLAYTFISHKKSETFYNTIQKNIKTYRKFDYLVKFSSDYQKLYLYENSSRGLINTYKHIKPWILYSVLISYLNQNYPTNDEFEPFKEIIVSDICNLESIQKLCAKYKIKYDTKILASTNYKTLKNSTLYVSEDNKAYISNQVSQISDAMIALSIISDMVNYYKTQNTSILKLYKNLNKANEPVYIHSFANKVNLKNLGDFETKLFMQKDIAGFQIETLDDLRYIHDQTDKYICKIKLFDKHELFIKYSYQFASIVCYVKEIGKSKNKIFKKVSQFFKRFTLGYDNYILKTIEQKTKEVKNTIEFKTETIEQNVSGEQTETKTEEQVE